MNALNTKYKVLIDFDFQLNEKLINVLYLPILGMEPLMLYRYLINTYAYQQHMGTIFQLELDALLTSLKINLETLQTLLNQLEACELMKTYTDVNKQDLIVYHVHEPLKWKTFTQHPYLFNLFKSSVTELEIEKTKFLFADHHELSGLVNISKTLENVYHIENPKNINFDLLYDFMFNQTRQIVNLTDNVRVKINNAFLKWNLNYNDVYQILTHSLIKQTHDVIVDEQLIDLSIKKIIDVRNIAQFNQQLKINRNQKIFLQDADLAAFSYVIEDYKTLNSEQYLACIQKHALNELDKNLISGLRENYQLPDFVINVLIDFCIFKNAGRIEPLYIHKIALTINRLNLASIPAILKHLQVANQDHQKTMHQQQNKVDW